MCGRAGQTVSERIRDAPRELDLQRLADLQRIGRTAWSATSSDDLASLRTTSNALRSVIGLSAVN